MYMYRYRDTGIDINMIVGRFCEMVQCLLCMQGVRSCKLQNKRRSWIYAFLYSSMQILLWPCISIYLSIYLYLSIVYTLEDPKIFNV